MPRFLSLVSAVVVTAVALGAAPATVRKEHLVFVGTYTTDTNPNSTSKGIYSFRFDDATGALTPVGLAAETSSPSFLTASADGRFVFAVNELQTYQGTPTGLVSSFAVDRATGLLRFISSQPSGGAGPCHLVLDATGRYLAVANYNGGNFALFPVGTDGRLSPSAALVTGEATTGPDGATLKPLAHMVAFDKTNKYLVASDKGLNKLLVFRFDAATGALAPNQPPSSPIPQPKAGPRHFGFDPQQRFVYSLGEQSATVTSFAWDGAKGTLTPIGAVSTRPAGVLTGSTAELVVHPSGRFVYASNRSAASTIAVFRVEATGALTLVEHEVTRGATARNFNLDPSGRWLIAANQGSSTLAVFRVDQAAGALDPVGDLVTAPTPVSVIFVE